MFAKCFDDVVNKRLPNLNANIFRTNQSGAVGRPSNFTQVVPSQEYRENKRGSVFQKVDLNSLDFSKIPNFKKTAKQMDEIMPLLRNNFLTKNLNESEIEKLAGAMKPEVFKKGSNIIKYGDHGTHYYVLSKGSVRVVVYKKGTPYDDPDLDKKQQFIKHM